MRKANQMNQFPQVGLEVLCQQLCILHGHSQGHPRCRQAIRCRAFLVATFIQQPEAEIGGWFWLDGLGAGREYDQTMG